MREFRPRLKEYAYITPASPARCHIGTVPLRAVTVELGIGELKVLEGLLDGRHTVAEIQRAVQRKLGLDRRWLAAFLDELRAAKLLEDGPRRSTRTLGRYRSQLQFFSMFTGREATPSEIQRVLAAKCVCVVGAGGVGCHALSALAQAGVGRLVAVDYDTVSLSNLNRQVLYSESDIGAPKHAAACDRLRHINPSVDVQGRKVKVLSESDADNVVAGADFVLCTADFPFVLLNRWLNKACIERGIPWLAANIGEIVGTLGPLVIPRRTGCFECLERHYRRHNQDYDYQIDTFLDSDEGSEAAYHKRSATLGACVGVVGNLAAWETIRFLSSIDEPISQGAVLSLDLSSCRSQLQKIPRFKTCAVCGRKRPPKSIS